MRKARPKADSALPVAYYHVVSRVVNRAFVLGDEEKEHFLRLMRRYETFSGVRIVTFCLMSNHFHLLVEVPARPDVLPSDEELLRRVAAINGHADARELRLPLGEFRSKKRDDLAEALRARYFERMWDVSFFMKTLKQRFTQWFNRRHKRTDTLWEERFKSVLVEAACDTLATMAAYIDLNPVRAGIVADPKEYRWCGYGQTVAGDKRAKEGFSVIVSYFRNQPMTRADKILREYRVHLYMEGEEKGIAESEVPAQSATAEGETAPLRRGFSREAIAQVLANKGRLSQGELLRCRVRYFVDGAVIGSKAFVDRVFESNRERFGPARADGARRMRLCEAKLYSLRDLQRTPIAAPALASEA